MNLALDPKTTEETVTQRRGFGTRPGLIRFFGNAPYTLCNLPKRQ